MPLEERDGRGVRELMVSVPQVRGAVLRTRGSHAKSAVRGDAPKGDEWRTVATSGPRGRLRPEGTVSVRLLDVPVPATPFDALCPVLERYGGQCPTILLLCAHWPKRQRMGLSVPDGASRRHARIQCSPGTPTQHQMLPVVHTVRGSTQNHGLAVQGDWHSARCVTGVTGLD